MPSTVPSLRPLARLFRRSPGFVLVAVLTLGVGIGANAAIFSVVNAVLIRPLPYPDPEELVAVSHTAPGLGMEEVPNSDATYFLYRGNNRSLRDLGIYHETSASLTGDREPERVEAAVVTGSLFPVLRVPPVLGRTLQGEDERPAAEKVVLLSHELWRRRFGGDPGVVGTTVRVDGELRRVIGVMPEGFQFPARETRLWLPMTVDPANLAAGSFNYDGLGRLRPGMTPERAQRDLAPLVWRIPEAGGEAQGLNRAMIEQAKLAIRVQPLRDVVVGEIERILWVLLGSVGLILLIACANVANLFLVRAESRQREVAVRTALGASRREIALLFLAESVALALAGGLLGIALAAAGVRLLVSLRPQGIPRLEEIGVDAAVLAFTVLLSLLSGLLVGFLAVLRYGTPDLVPSLKEGGRGGMAGRARHRARNALVVVQVALALVLLVGAGLMAQSFWRLRNVDPGLRPADVLTLSLNLPETEYADQPAIARFVQQLLERVQALPGVAAAGTVTELPLGGRLSRSGYTIEDFPRAPDDLPPILGSRFASPGYFEALGIPLLQGRIFGRLDPGRPIDEVVVSEALAKRFWPQENALGKRLTPLSPEEGQWFTIVGVVGGVREMRLEEEPLETVYYPLRWRAAGAPDASEGVERGFSLVVRGDGTADPRSLAGPVRDAIRTLDPNLPLFEMRTMEEVVARSMARTSFTMLLLLIAAAVALLLGTVGIYGVISYVVSQRTQEIGVRMALGAGRQDIARMVLREGLVLTLLGIVIGLAVAFAITRLMLALLYDVSATEPATFALVPLLLALVALFASWLPARRAAAVEPLEAIRYE